ncbi:tRNA (carboxymethyluridine(34)-5-O)-methyltransferase [Cyphellophora attinorum]|uniref:tRNA (Carboxymethyluridine(34)-5-O)-methyltransferase n=1 Tax=Cyphellophora attinorum TaxID=1664694 RepID=A0A0N1HJI1_9EURO|nr:tRNA (carboxymethyluridine(34)-5-O)-methyltransferase [Phialophora attinorum]KPI36627.1 tRNA (carboxymethyluridine(34)-5-O)-methyltransferase [Phialophora attinorum]
MTDATNNDDALNYEQTHVHAVYDSIAAHFSSTRYKPWPVVDAFLRQLRPGSVGLDVGCGNGKYLNVNQDVFIVGSDRSTNLVQLARQNQVTRSEGTGVSRQDVVVADSLSLPHPLHAFDFAICIAVVHHLSSTERRVAAIKAILDVLRRSTPDQPDEHRARPPTSSIDGHSELGSTTFPTNELPPPPTPGAGLGQALIFVWALEQSATSKRGWKDGDAQDVLVPWVLKDSAKASRASSETTTTSNAGPPHNVEADDEPSGKSDSTGGGGEDKVYNRFYHLYRKGELESECEAAGGNVVKGGYDRDNWWVIVEPS